ncbi:MAG TPA: preprotein translocase subunit YajC [Candidatus Acidoferrales bacterium]|nr:preprotein translocase subunit YajC [Candidatus Acidoferrales bacterium]
MLSAQLNLYLMAQASGPGGLMAFLPLVIIMVIFYVLLILPAQRRQKKTQQMISALKNGDKVVTNGGLFGTIVGLEGDAVQLRIADQVKVKILRSAIAGLQPESKEES